MIRLLLISAHLQLHDSDSTFGQKYPKQKPRSLKLSANLGGSFVGFLFGLCFALF